MKAGQFVSIDGSVYRCKKRTSGCTGCVLNSFIRCPNIVDFRNGQRPLSCAIDNIIFVKP